MVVSMKKILVLCTGNSCRSQMAHGYLQHFGKGKVEVYGKQRFRDTISEIYDDEEKYAVFQSSMKKGGAINDFN